MSETQTGAMASGESPRRGKSPGPHREHRLTAAFVKSAPPGRHTDGGGLYLVVTPTGARRWLVRLVVRGERRDFSLGSAKLTTLSDARAKAFEYRRIARAGGDPAREQDRGKVRTVSFSVAAREIHKSRIQNGCRNGKHVDQWINTLETYAFPVIGKLAVADVSAKDIQKVLEPIWTSKQETARRVLQRLKLVFDWSILNEYRSSVNPVVGVRIALPRQTARVRHFAAIPWVETSNLFAALENTAGIGATALRFTMLTAMRSGAVRKATWDQFSEDLWMWSIPAENMKSGKDFEVPMSAQARAILVERKKNGSREIPLVFPSPSRPRKPISENTMAQVLKRFYPDKTVHGMRSAFRDWAEIFADVRREVAEFALAHGNLDRVESAYLRTDYMNEREELMDVWGAWLDNAEGSYSDILQELRAIETPASSV